FSLWAIYRETFFNLSKLSKVRNSNRIKDLAKVNYLTYLTHGLYRAWGHSSSFFRCLNPNLMFLIIQSLVVVTTSDTAANRSSSIRSINFPTRRGDFACSLSSSEFDRIATSVPIPNWAYRE